jgi:hypothetical protein
LGEISGFAAGVRAGAALRVLTFGFVVGVRAVGLWAVFFIPTFFAIADFPAFFATFFVAAGFWAPAFFFAATDFLAGWGDFFALAFAFFVAMPSPYH